MEREWILLRLRMWVSLGGWRTRLVRMSRVQRCIIKLSSEFSPLVFERGSDDDGSSLALISARATVTALDVLTMLIASYLYILCQGLDLRALQSELVQGLDEIVAEELVNAFGSSFDTTSLAKDVSYAMRQMLDETSTMDAVARMQKVAGASSTLLINFFASKATTPEASTLASSALLSIPTFQTALSTRLTALLIQLRTDYLSGKKGSAPASSFLNKTRPVYEYVRVTLGVGMHGNENASRFEGGVGVREQSIGQQISRIYEAIRDGKMQSVVAALFDH